MNSPYDVSQELAAFTGKAPLFPLPNVVFFPHILLPLHIFEPRYRQMVADALEGDRLLAMALLKSQPLSNGPAVPAIHPTVCLGKIISHEQLPDGRSNLVLQGLSRARVLAEETSSLPYRIGELELLQDFEPPGLFELNRQRREEMLVAFRQLHPELDLQLFFHQALEADVPLGIVCDVLGYALQLPPKDAQRLLNALDVNQRSQLLLYFLNQLIPPGTPGFPPRFSIN